MRPRLTGLASLALACSLAEAYVAASFPSVRDVSLRTWAFAVGCVAIVGILAALRRTLPGTGRSAFEAALVPQAERAPAVSELERLQREVVLATSTSWDLHYRLLPQLREIAEARLAQAGRRLGPDTLGRWWDLLRPDRLPPEERFAPGMPADDLRALVFDLERL